MMSHPNLLSTIFESQFSKHSFVKKQMVFIVNDPVLHFYQVETGLVKLCRYNAKGQPMTMQIAKAGDILSEASLFSEHYHCFAECLATSTLAVFKKSDILHEMSIYPQKAMLILQIYSKELRNLRHKLEDNASQTADERLLSYLQKLSLEQNSKQIHLPFSLLELSFELGVQSETLYRLFAKLEKKGILTKIEGIISLQ
jgi:CRP-like cAMP-binding protein